MFQFIPKGSPFPWGCLVAQEQFPKPAGIVLVGVGKDLMGQDDRETSVISLPRGMDILLLGNARNSEPSQLCRGHLPVAKALNDQMTIFLISSCVS